MLVDDQVNGEVSKSMALDRALEQLKASGIALSVAMAESANICDEPEAQEDAAESEERLWRWCWM